MVAAETSETERTCGIAKAMDCLWFFPKSPSDEITKTPLPTSQSPDYSSSSRNSSQSQISVNSTTGEISSGQESDGDKRRTTYGNRPSMSVQVSGQARCHSSSPSSISSARRSKRSESCKSLGDAELEELKGFVDLGFFDFEREEEVSEHLVRLIPGLRRIDDCSDLNYRSPLMTAMDLRGERASDVKSRLKWWARTVALAVQRDSLIFG